AWKPGIEAHHGGGDYVMLKAFISAVELGREPFISVYDAVTWSVVIPLSGESIAEGRRVEFPKFR
ncbi:MAG: gfo/Idh/MocA family oxidoreductase, partial [Thermoprotei archaeon]